VCVRGRSDGGATWLERWKIARLWCKHVIAFYLQKLTTNCTHKTFLILKKHSLAVGKKREKKEESIDPANERRIV
jgi:hypothetical protein